MGRPTRYTPELASEICTRIASGESLRKICRSPDIPVVSTVLRWALQADQDEVGDFREQYARARELQAELRADEIVDIADAAKDAARARVRVDARKWVAAKLLPRRFGSRVALDHTGFNPTINLTLQGDGEPVDRLPAEGAEEPTEG
jgi:hypothetical protein